VRCIRSVEVKQRPVGLWNWIMLYMVKNKEAGNFKTSLLCE